MSNPFTNPLSEVPLQDLLDELTLAYSERRQALGQPAYTPSAGRDWQDPDFWSGLQYWILGAGWVWVDFINGPLTPDATGYQRLGSAEGIYAAAGLPPDGFRRATDWDGNNDPEWSYGLFQTGDIIGPWLIEDLQKAFSALRWTTRSCQVVESEQRSAYAGNASCEVALAAAKADYDASSWIDLGLSVYYAVGVLVDRSNWVCHRRRGKFKIQNLPDYYRTIEFYGNVHRPYSGMESEFLDIDNLGLSEYALHLWAQTPLFNDSEYTTEYASSAETNPFDLVPWVSCPSPYVVFGVGAQENNPSSALIKWQFTNQNEVL